MGNDYALTHRTTGVDTPMYISEGGLKHGRVRYFDTAKKRQGLLQSVSASVEKLTLYSAMIHLVNTDGEMYDSGNKSTAV